MYYLKKYFILLNRIQEHKHMNIANLLSFLVFQFSEKY